MDEILKIMYKLYELNEISNMKPTHLYTILYLNNFDIFFDDENKDIIDAYNNDLGIKFKIFYEYKNNKLKIINIDLEGV